MYKPLMDEKALNDCLAKENYLEAIQMVRKEILDNFERYPELMESYENIYKSVSVVVKNESMTAKVIYDFINTMRQLMMENEGAG